jgi:hypothetical protein
MTRCPLPAARVFQAALSRHELLTEAILIPAMFMTGADYLSMLTYLGIGFPLQLGTLAVLIIMMPLALITTVVGLCAESEGRRVVRDHTTSEHPTS